MREAHGLLHNMSAPPKSVLRYEGLAGLASQSGPGGSGVTQLRYTAKEFFGTPVRFAFDLAWTKLSAIEILNYLQVEVMTTLPANSQAGEEPSVEKLKALSTARAQAATRQLNALINQRAQAMPLPEGCAVIVPRPEHAVLFADLLSTLAVFSKCTESIWLRSKTPSLIAARGYREVSLLIPPNFYEKLSRFSC
ncbi:MAG: hypothetical protein ACOYMH_14505 [Zwartia sp.]